MKSSPEKAPNSPTKKNLIGRWMDFVRRHTLPFVVVVALGVGAVVGVPVADVGDRYFSSNSFCATGCHVMEATVYKEFRDSTHWNTATGVRPTCADCHVSKALAPAWWDHVLGTKELFANVVLGIRTAEDFEKVRAKTADTVRFRMLGNDSKNCRSCHLMEAIQPARKRGQRQHAEAKETGTTCIVCHYNLVHKEVEPSEAFLEAAEGR